MFENIIKKLFAFAIKGNQTTWKVSPYQNGLSDKETLSKLSDETRVLLCYNDTEYFSVNHHKNLIFTLKSRSLENLPSTKEELRHYTYKWGWTMVVVEWTPVWSSLSSNMETCRELVQFNYVGCRNWRSDHDAPFFARSALESTMSRS